MNVAAHQDKEKNEKMDKRKAGEERGQETDFREAACCPFAVVQGHHGEKMVCVRGMPGVTGTLGKANIHFDPTKRVEESTTTLRRLLIRAVQFCSLYIM